MSNFMPYLLLFVGLLLLFLEFYTPGGILAALGALFLLAAIFTFLSSSTSLLGSVAFALFTVAAIIYIIYFALRRIRLSGKQDTFYLSKDQEGYQSSHFDSTLIGKRGINSTDLGPSGFVIIEGKRYQASCRTGYLDKGHTIEVIGGEGACLIVKQVI